MQTERRAVHPVLRLLAEFLVVVLGILAAFAVDRWQERRAARQVESRLLAGVAADLVRDSLDLEASMSVAAERLLAANDVLELLGQPRIAMDQLDDVPVAQRYLEVAAELRGSSPTLRESLRALGRQFRFDVADATFSEALASGAWNAVSDPELRRRITRYYSTVEASGQTPDERFEVQARDLRAALATGGIAVSGAYDDDELRGALRSDPRIAAAILNTREFATAQLFYHSVIWAAGDSLRRRLRAGR